MSFLCGTASQVVSLWHGIVLSCAVVLVVSLRHGIASDRIQTPNAPFQAPRECLRVHLMSRDALKHMGLCPSSLILPHRHLVKILSIFFSALPPSPRPTSVQGQGSGFQTVQESPETAKREGRNVPNDPQESFKRATGAPSLPPPPASQDDPSWTREFHERAPRRPEPA